MYCEDLHILVTIIVYIKLCLKTGAFGLSILLSFNKQFQKIVFNHSADQSSANWNYVSKKEQINVSHTDVFPHSQTNRVKCFTDWMLGTEQNPEIKPLLFFFFFLKVFKGNCNLGYLFSSMGRERKSTSVCNSGLKGLKINMLYRKETKLCWHSKSDRQSENVCSRDVWLLLKMKKKSK